MLDDSDDVRWPARLEVDVLLWVRSCNICVEVTYEGIPTTSAFNDPICLWAELWSCLRAEG